MAGWSNGGRNYGGPSPIGGSPAPSMPTMPPGPLSPPPQRPVMPPPGTAAWQPPSGPVGPPPQQPVTPQVMGPAAGRWEQLVTPPVMGPPTGAWPPPPRGSRWWRDPNRRPLVWTVGAGAALVVIVAIILGFTVAGRGGAAGAINGGGSAGDLVKSYLEALARGDAQAALSASDDQPGSTEFLSDDVLNQQIAKWPITNIRILGDDSSGSDSMAGAIGYAQVHFAATFGEKVSDTTLTVRKQNGRWRLDTAAIKLSPELPGLNFAASKTLMLFGKPFTDVAYVFPGWIALTSSNPYLNVGDQVFLLDKLMAGTNTGAYVQPQVTVNDAGRKAVDAAVAAAFASCQSSKQFAPPRPCPVALANDDGSLVDGTVKWGAADLSALKQDYFDASTLSLSIMGEVRVPVSAQQRDGGTNSGDIKHFISARVDLSATPPKVTFSN